MIKILTRGIIISLIATMPGFAAIESDQPELLCTITHVAECANNSQCIRTQAPEINVPTFLKIDLAGRLLSSMDETRKGETTPIDTMTVIGDRLIMSGIDGNRTWSAVISINTGEITSTIADHDLAFLLFGKCIAP